MQFPTGKQVLERAVSFPHWRLKLKLESILLTWGSPHQNEISESVAGEMHSLTMCLYFVSKLNYKRKEGQFFFLV